MGEAGPIAISFIEHCDSKTLIDPSSYIPNSKSQNGNSGKTNEQNLPDVKLQESKDVSTTKQPQAMATVASPVQDIPENLLQNNETPWSPNIDAKNEGKKEKKSRQKKPQNDRVRVRNASTPEETKKETSQKEERASQERSPSSEPQVAPNSIPNSINNELKSENNALTQQLAELQKELETLKSQKDFFKKESLSARQQNLSLQKENKSLQNDIKAQQTKASKSNGSSEINLGENEALFDSEKTSEKTSEESLETEENEFKNKGNKKEELKKEDIPESKKEPSEREKDKKDEAKDLSSKSTSGSGSIPPPPPSGGVPPPPPPPPPGAGYRTGTGMSNPAGTEGASSFQNPEDKAAYDELKKSIDSIKLSDALLDQCYDIILHQGTTKCINEKDIKTRFNAIKNRGDIDALQKEVETRLNTEKPLYAYGSADLQKELDSVRRKKNTRQDNLNTLRTQLADMQQNHRKVVSLSDAIKGFELAKANYFNGLSSAIFALTRKSINGSFPFFSDIKEEKLSDIQSKTFRNICIRYKNKRERIKEICFLC